MHNFYDYLKYLNLECKYASFGGPLITGRFEKRANGSLNSLSTESIW